MNLSRKIDRANNSEVNLKSFIQRVFKYWYLFLLSLALCLTLAYLYTKWATPIYEVSTSLLIDDSGASRKMGESKYLDGAVGLIATEKNLFNEMGIIKSHALIQKTLEELGYNTTYHTKEGFKKREQHAYFPFEVERLETTTQLYGVPVYVQPVSDEEYILKIEADKFNVYTPETGVIREVEQEFLYEKRHHFGEVVNHNYFNFIIKKPSYEVVESEFADKELYFQMHDYEGLANAYLSSKLSVERTDIQASILKLTTQGPVLEKEIAFLKKLTDNYIAEKLMERDEIASSKLNFIKQQLANVTDSLTRAERNLEKFKSRYNAVNLEHSARSAMDNIQSLEQKKGQIELNLKYYKSLLNYLKDEGSINKIVAPSVVGIDDPLLNENLLELKRLKSERTKSTFYKGKRSFDLEILDQQIRNTIKSLEENVRNLIKSSEIALQDRDQRIKKFEGAINTLPRNEKKLASYERKRALHLNLYNYLSQELAKTGIARAEDMTDTRVLDEARMMEGGPVSPQKLMTMLLAGLIGLILPLLWVIFSTPDDGTIVDTESIERYTDIPLLTSVAQVNDSTLFKSKSNAWQLEESFRDLSANLRFLIPDASKNVIGITSTVPGEGKSFCATNLAMNLAKSGKKVLLIDTDLRKNSPLAKGDNAEGKAFLKYLRGEINFDESMVAIGDNLQNFHFIPTDVSSDYSPELLSGSRFQVLISAMKVEYDYVIIDSPAVGVVSDYLLISKNIDVHLFVVRNGISKMSYIKRLEQLKTKGNLEKVFLLFNGMKKGDFKYGLDYGSGEIKERVAGIKID